MVSFSGNGHDFKCVFRAYSTIAKLRETRVNQRNPRAVVKGNSHGRLGGMHLPSLEMEFYLCYPDI